MCVEGISCALKKAADECIISGCRIHAQAPSVMHLLFAEDNFIICKSTKDEVSEIKGILKKYEIQSGQAINFQKSGICFSPNIRVDKHMNIKNMLEVHNDLSEGKYLGLPSFMGRCRKRVFNFLKDHP